MRVLIVSNNYPHPDIPINPIVQRIVEATRLDSRVASVEFVPFTNSVSDFIKIRRAANKCDVIHVHFGGIYAFLVWLALIGIRIPKFITFHGTDIHMGELATEKRLLKRLKIQLNQKCSFLSLLCFNGCGFVNEGLLKYIPVRLLNKTQNKCFIQSLGVDYSLFTIGPKEDARAKLGICQDKTYVMFSDLSGTPLKRRDIAESIVNELGPEYELLVMSRVKPDMVPIYLNACDCLLLTSDAEGSPNIVREALALNVPVFSVDVGDVAQQIDGLSNSAIISREPTVAASLIRKKMQNLAAENTREIMRSKLDITELSSRAVDLYQTLI